MTVNLFTFVDLYARVLATCEHLLVKGVEHAQGIHVSEQDMLNWRLIDDMQPLKFQLMVVCNYAQQWPARVAGISVPPDISDQLDVSGFRMAISTSRSFLSGLRVEQFNGRDNIPITFTVGTGMELTLPAAQWLTVFATTNLYFHLSTAYGVLRTRGVQIGKRDLFASGL